MGKFWYWGGPWSISPVTYRAPAIEEIVRTTMRIRVARGHSYNSGAVQRIVASAGNRTGDALINRLHMAFRIQEREAYRQYWGA